MPSDAAARRISRRRMLKRLGAGAAVAWSAPILTSLRTPAFAQYGARCAPTNAFCGNTDPECGGTSGCPDTGGRCAVADDGSCVCWCTAVCQSVDPICESDTDCTQFGAGKCAPTTCDICAGNKTCLYTCEEPQPRALPRGEGILFVNAR
jgi:hypothetical protein